MGEAWQWVQDHASVLSAIGTLVMAVVWLVYLQLFYAEQRRRHRPQLEIQQSAERDPDAPCLVANMSMEPVFIVCAVAVVEGEEDETARQLTVRPSPGPGEELRQGPLSPGQTLSLGPLRDMLADATGRIADDAQALEVRIVALHGPTRHHVGAVRRYTITRQNDQLTLLPATMQTQQLHRRRDRHEVRRWAEACLTLQTPPRTKAPDADDAGAARA